jgi:hypothetical protein
MNNVSILDLKDYYHFEERKEWIKRYYEGMLQRFESHIAQHPESPDSFWMQKELGSIRTILASDQMLEKATVIDTIQQLRGIFKRLFRGFSSYSASNRIYDNQEQPYINAFGIDFVIPASISNYSIEDARRLLFDAVSLEFIPADAMVSIANQYNNCVHRWYEARNHGGLTPEISQEKTFLENQLEEMGIKSLISYKYNSEQFGALMVSELNFDYARTIPVLPSISEPTEVITFPDQYLCQRSPISSKIK